GRLGRIKRSMITEPAYALDAAKLFRRMKQFEEVDLINSAAIKRDSPIAEEHSLYEAVHTDIPYADWCLKRYLGRIQKCETVEELDHVYDGVTPDCYSYSGYRFRHLKKKDYTLRACIGTKASRAKLEELEQEVHRLEQELQELLIEEHRLREVQSYESRNQDPAQLTAWSRAGGQLEERLKRQEKLQNELKELEDGTLVADLKR